MTITIRSSDPGGWTKIPHVLARDPRLSNGARGLAVQMLSHADGFRSDEQSLAEHTAEGRDAVRRQLAELRKYGYLVRERVRGPDGKLTTRSVLYDVPQGEPPIEEPPSRGKPATRSDQGRFAKRQTAPHAGDPRDGTTRPDASKPQVTPTRGQAATRDDQHEHGIVAGRADSRETRAHVEDQGEDQEKKISQSGRDRQAARWLHTRYRLTDQEAAHVIREVRRRAAHPIASLVPYMAGMAEGDLADIAAAVMDATEAAARPDTTTAATAAPRRGRDRTVAEAIAAATPDHRDDQAHAEHGHEGVPDAITRLGIAGPPCPHGTPDGAAPRPGDGLPSCGPCRAHAIVCARPPARCSTCQAINAARSAGPGSRESA